MIHLPILLLLAASLAHASMSSAQTRADPEAATGLTAKPLLEARQHMIVAAHPAASAAGLLMLREGGSAADAAISALLVLNVVEPQSSGIGGGAFALIHGSDGTTSFDARETAPLTATPELFFVDGEPLDWRDAVPTGRSVGTPGLVALMQRLHDTYGILSWPRLFRPAIELAEEGFPVSPRLAMSILRFEEQLSGTDAARLFMPGGIPLAEGEMSRNPALARALRRIALSGADVFYRGTLASDIVNAVHREPIPGALSLEDLAAYRVIERDPVCLDYRAFSVCGMGPPSSGATTVGQILGLIEAKGKLPDDPTGIHLFAEASRLAYADRGQYLADPDLVRVPVRGLLDPGYLADRAGLIDPGAASTGQATAGDPPWRQGHFAPDQTVTSPGTTHLSVMDASGLAISLTASIETAFGSKRIASGFLLNNQLTDFSLTPKGSDGTPIANAPDAGKRPRSSMAPTLVFEGSDLRILAGSPGGSRIPEYVAQTLTQMIDHGLNPADAVAVAHISDRNRGTIVLEDQGTEQAVVDTLVEMGHSVELAPMTSGLHVIEIGADGTLFGGADPRREGVALGD